MAVPGSCIFTVAEMTVCQVTGIVRVAGCSFMHTPGEICSFIPAQWLPNLYEDSCDASHSSCTQMSWLRHHMARHKNLLGFAWAGIWSIQIIVLLNSEIPKKELTVLRYRGNSVSRLLWTQGGCLRASTLIVCI